MNIASGFVRIILCFVIEVGAFIILDSHLLTTTLDGAPRTEKAATATADKLKLEPRWVCISDAQ